MEGSNLPRINFVANWNNKLWNEMFPTMRPANPAKYQVGQIYNCYLKDEFYGRVQLMEILNVSYPKINNRMAFADCGRPAAYLKTLLSKFYPKANWSTQKLYWLWFKHLDHEKTRTEATKTHVEQLSLFNKNRSPELAQGRQSA